MARTPCFALLALLTLPAAGCGCDGDDSPGITAEPGLESRPDDLREHRLHTDLMRLVHLADLDHHGLFIDMGTPAHAKYTVGDWRSGWGTDVADGDTTATYVERRGRIYFHADEARALTVRVRLRPFGTRAMTPWINNRQLQSLQFAEHTDFRDYDFAVPAENVVRGENYLLLTFGGVVRIGDEDVSVAVDSIRIVPGAIPDGEFTPPTYASLTAPVRIGGEERRAIAVRRPTSLGFYVQLPASAHLSFGYGFEGQGESAVKVMVTPEDGGRATEIFAGTARGEWQAGSADLSRWANRIVRIDFRAEGSGAGRLAWSSPALLVPPVEEPEDDPRVADNVVVLLIDTLRADKLRPFNPRTRVRTPVIDRLATEGAVFEQAQAPENWTKPSVASVLTGLYPMTHGTKESESRLPAAATLVSEHLKGQGFTTASFIANGYVSDRFGFDQGWDHYTNFIRESKNTDASSVFGEAIQWIESHHDRRFFVYIQTIDPHVPYDPPAEYLRMYDPREDYAGQVTPRRTPDLLEQAKRNPPQVTFDASDRRRLLALHDGEISQHDFEMGRFIARMQELNLWDETLFVIVSDHGEEFGEHGSWGHGHSVYQELLHVPLMFRLPGSVPAGLRVSDTVSTLDIPATVLALAGIDPLPHDEGRNLVGFFRGQPPAGPNVAFSDFLDDRRVITAGRFKLILRGNLTASIFDLESDPGETQQLDLSRFPIGERFCRIHLGQFLGATDRAHWIEAVQGRGPTFGSEAAEMDDTIRGQLRALGYAN